MSDYLDVVQFKQNKGGKWRAIRLGSAKKNDKGQLDVWLDALPMPDAEGQCRMTITVREERGERQEPPRRETPRDDFGDSIPF